METLYLKCKKCGDLVNLIIWGGPKDICIGCLTGKEKDKIVEKEMEREKRNGGGNKESL